MTAILDEHVDRSTVSGPTKPEHEAVLAFAVGASIYLLVTFIIFVDPFFTSGDLVLATAILVLAVCAPILFWRRRRRVAVGLAAASVAVALFTFVILLAVAIGSGGS